MAAVFQPPPTWAMPIEINELTQEAHFSPVWLKWFLDLTEVLNAVGGGAGIVSSFNTRTGAVTMEGSDTAGLDLEAHSIALDASSGGQVRTIGAVSNGTGSSGTGFDYNLLVANDNLDAGAGKVDGLRVYMNVGGSNTKGGRHGIETVVDLVATTSATNTDRNYVGGAFTGAGSVSDGGTAGAEKGAVFGTNPVALLKAGATNFSSLVGEEVNISAATGSSMLVKNGLRVFQWGTDKISGSIEDAGLSFTNEVGAVGWRAGILFSNASGVYPIKATGFALQDTGNNTATIRISAGTHVYGIDMKGALFTIGAIRVPNGATGQIGARNNLDTGDVPMIKLTSADWVEIGGTGAGAVSVNNHFGPAADATYLCGSFSFRWTEVWAVNGTIQTSDERRKMDILALPSTLDLVCAISPVTYKWRERGIDTRTHWGFLAQDVKANFDNYLPGRDFGGHIESPDGMQSLRSDELVPVLWKAVQELREEVRTLKQKVSEL